MARPELLTVATLGLSDVHVTVAPGMVVPEASFTVALNCQAAPMDNPVIAVGETTTSAGVGAGSDDTVMDAVSEPQQAALTTMRAVPTPAAVTLPDESTVAIPGSRLCQESVGLDTVLPVASVAVAES